MFDNASLSMPPVRRLLMLLPAVLLAWLIASISGVRAQEGILAVDCEGNTAQVETECEFGEQQAFTISIHAVSAPGVGYPTLQAKLRWDDATVDYRPSDEPGQEVVWPDCDIPLRRDNRPGDPSVVVGCVTSPLEPSSYTGPLFLFGFACVGPGTAQLTLVPTEADAPDGSHFIELDAEGVPRIVDPELHGAIITCAGPAVPRPTPEVTTQPPPTQSPAANATPGAGDGTTAQALDDGPDATATAQALAFPSLGAARAGDRGDGPTLWAVIALLIIGAGGVLAAVVVAAHSRSAARRGTSGGGFSGR